MTTRRFRPLDDRRAHDACFIVKAANGRGVSKRHSGGRAVKNNCNVVKMIVQRGRSRTIKKILSLDMGLPRVQSMAKADFAAFATANRRPFARFPASPCCIPRVGDSV